MTNQRFVFHFSGQFLLNASIRRRKNSVYRIFPYAANTLNYTSEFWERCEPAMYNLSVQLILLLLVV